MRSLEHEGPQDYKGSKQSEDLEYSQGSEDFQGLKLNKDTKDSKGSEAPKILGTLGTLRTQRALGL